MILHLVTMDNRNCWQWAMPPWPVVPARLWLTGAGPVLAVLSLAFRQEKWPHHPQVAPWNRATPALLAQIRGVQVIRVLRRWAGIHAGLSWTRSAVRGMSWVGSIGIAILLLVLFLLRRKLRRK